MAVAAGRIDSVMDPTDATVAMRYAEALGQLHDKESAEAIGAEFHGLVRLADEVEGFDELFTDAMLSRSQRCELVQRVFDGRTSESLSALLGVMARNDRLGLLRQVCRAFDTVLDERLGRVEVIVTTAIEMDDKQRRQLVKTLGEMLDATPRVNTRVDAELIGGMVVRVGDRVYDASIAGDLQRLRARIAQPRPCREGPAKEPTDEIQD